MDKYLFVVHVVNLERSKSAERGSTWAWGEEAKMLVCRTGTLYMAAPTVLHQGLDHRCGLFEARDVIPSQVYWLVEIRLNTTIIQYWTLDTGHWP